MCFLPCLPPYCIISQVMYSYKMSCDETQNWCLLCDNALLPGCTNCSLRNLKLTSPCTYANHIFLVIRFICIKIVGCKAFSWRIGLLWKNFLCFCKETCHCLLPWLSIYLKKKKTSDLHWSPVADCPGIIQQYCTTTAKNETHTYYTLMRVGFVWRKVKVLSHFIHSTSLLH